MLMYLLVGMRGSRKKFLGETSERGLCLEEWGGPNAVFGNFNVNKRNFSIPGGPNPSPPITDPRLEGMKMCSMADNINPSSYWKYACFGVG